MTACSSGQARPSKGAERGYLDAGAAEAVV